MIEPGEADKAMPAAVVDFTVFDADGSRHDLHMELKEGAAFVMENDEVGLKHGWGPCKHKKTVHFLRIKATP